MSVSAHICTVIAFGSQPRLHCNPYHCIIDTSQFGDSLYGARGCMLSASGWQTVEEDVFYFGSGSTSLKALKTAKRGCIEI